LGAPPVAQQDARSLSELERADFFGSVGKDRGGRESERAMRLGMHHRRRFGLVVLLASTALVLPGIATSEATPTIEAFNASNGTHSWKPPTATIIAGGGVNITNPTSVLHGVEWRSGPTTPSCTSGVPVGTTPAASGTNWSGTCTFSQPGTYTFFCTVHGPEMTGTVTVRTTPPLPTVTKLAPRRGPATGKTAVVITGTNFTGATAVDFGAVGAEHVTVNSDTSITAESPAEPAGVVDVRVTTPGGTSAASRHDHFKFKLVRHK
jgi:plastocyanin